MSPKKVLLAGAASSLAISIGVISQPAFAQDTTSSAPASSPPAEAAPTSPVNEIVVTGSTSKRTLLNASVAVTQVTNADLAQKAPRNTADILETIPGIFVEATAGPVSNNYSVRGLPGGGQQFVRLIEDGMPAIYGGLNDDEVFQYDASIDHVEGLQGGTSGILTPNAAGASINFISRKLNYDQGGGLFKITGTTYGEARSDFWYSAPIKALGPDVAFAVSGYLDSNPGQRDSQFRYQTYHVKAQLEKRWDDGGYIRATYKRWNEHDPYYADQPYSEQNGKITSVPGLNGQYGNIIGSGFGTIVMPDSCAAGECTRTFSAKEGIHAQGNMYRVDFSKPVGHGITLFAKARFTQTNWDFNGVFAGSGSGNAGLETAVNYLTPSAVSPLWSATLPASNPMYGGMNLFQAAALAFPGTTQFGIRNLSTGQVIAGSNTAALNALNGNGLLQQTWLNRQTINIHDVGSDFGAKWDASGSGWRNSLTVGGMIYHQRQNNDQSAVSNVLNDVTNNSSIYDVVALNAAGGIAGTLTNNGLLGYGDWGSGISYFDQSSQSIYANDEFTWHDKFHFDVGLRYEHESETSFNGNSAPAAIPAGTTGLLQVNPNAFNGTYSVNSGFAENPLNITAGVNYTANSHLSFYGRYAHSYQTNGNSSNGDTAITLLEAGVTYAAHGFVGSVRPFRTLFKNQSFNGALLDSSTGATQSFVADITTNGVDLDLAYRPEIPALRAFSIRGQATFQDPKYTSACLGSVVNGIVSNCAPFPAADGLTPGRTPKTMYTITPSVDLPHHLGSLYLRYKYIGKIFADQTATLPLPAYGVLSIGGEINVTDRATVNFSVENATNTLGLTEGNPRQGVSEQVVNGFFYGRGIVGTNGQVSLQYKF
jgi:outer membrane receptor protein involved in Fe transport